MANGIKSQGLFTGGVAGVDVSQYETFNLRSENYFFHSVIQFMKNIWSVPTMYPALF